MGQQERAAVATCQVTECSYNDTEMCHAPQIKVGDGHPQCDTFTTSQVQQRQMDMSSVNTCGVTDCSFNEARMCDAPGITVMHHTAHADCGTYRPR